MIKEIKIDDFFYDLPKKNIALHPLKKRDASKLLEYKKGKIKDTSFISLPKLLPPKAGLFMNNSKVIYARLVFFKTTNARIEIFCLEPYKVEPGKAMASTKKSCWICLIGNKKKWKGETLVLNLNEQVVLKANLQKESEQNLVELSWNSNHTFAQILEKLGEIPLPPYLNRKAEVEDYQRYQTVYGKKEGSVAAPTAGLHFTDTVFSQLKNHGITITEFTLHVGAGTFMPVKSSTIGRHDMHQEHIEITTDAVVQLHKMVSNNQPVFCVGTTTLRTLESLYWLGVRILLKQDLNVEQWDPYELQDTFSKNEIIEALLNHLSLQNGKLFFKTKIIIAPGYKFKFMTGLITNFHQPSSTLLLLISAIIGTDWKNVYKYALENNYRFLSYGDSSLLWIEEA